MNLRASVIAILLILGWFTPGLSQSSSAKNDTLEIANQDSSHGGIIDSIQVLIDPGGQLLFDDIQRAPSRDQFRPRTDTGNSYGINRNSYWFRVNVQFTDSARGDFYLEIVSSVLDEVTAYLPNGNGEWQTNTAGDTLPYSARMIDHQHLVYPLNTTTTAPQQIFLHVKGGGAKIVPIQLWDGTGFSKHENNEHIFTGITIGALISLVLFNAFLFMSLRDTTYLWYVGYLSFVALFLLNYSGMSHRYLWPNSSGWANPAGVVFLFLAMGFGLLFARKMLNIHQLSSRLSTVFILSSVMCFLLACLTLIVDPSLLLAIAIAMAVYAITLSLFAIIYSIRSRYTPALYVLIAFASLVPGAIITILKNIGVMESSFFSEHMLSISFIAEAILLSFALAYRIRYTNKKMDLLKEGVIKQRVGFSHQLVNAQDNERKYIAGELHDGLGQNLIVIKNKLRRYFRSGDKPDKNIGQTLDQLIQDSIDLVRGLSSRLYPHQLERIGLKSALENVIESSFSDANIKVDYQIDELGDDVDPQTQLHLYRICQEAIKNILTHANASQASIKLNKMEGGVVLKVTDNGKGVESSWLNQEDFSASFGLNSIKERVQLLRGNTVYSTSDEGGFSILVEIPFRRDD